MAEMQTLKIEVMRYNPESDAEPHFVTYAVPYDEQTSLLDALGYIKDNGAGSLLPLVLPHGDLRLLRHDGQPRAEAGVQNLPARLRRRHEGRSAGQLPDRARSGGRHDPLHRKPEAIKPTSSATIAKPEDGPNVQTPAQMAKYHQFSGCINCGLCYAACPQFGLNPEFIGPAAITLAHRYNPTTATTARNSACRSLTAKTASGAAPSSAIAPKSVRNTSIPPPPSSRARWRAPKTS